MYIFVRIGENGNSDVTEIPSESDGSLELSNIQAQFPEITGLRYQTSETSTWRAVRRKEDKFLPPQGGWGDKIYSVVKPSTGTVGLNHIISEIEVL